MGVYVIGLLESILILRPEFSYHSVPELARKHIARKLRNSLPVAHIKGCQLYKKTIIIQRSQLRLQQAYLTTILLLKSDRKTKRVTNTGVNYIASRTL